MNQMELILSQIMKSPEAQQNIALKSAIEKYQSGDNQGAIDVVKNTLKTNNVDIEKMQQQTINFVKGIKK